ncbi:MAG TPA: phosphoribosylanthranilate isomerase [Hyphomonadaceae bacterium]|nr:phosphoribosylanthranilate isomerase [Hyphomonadaceae bacterium]
MVSVKICGLTNESDLRNAIEAGADRVGFVLVASSPRHVSFEKASELVGIANEAGADVWVVAGWKAGGAPGQDALEAFISETPELGAIQLHGGETPADLADFARRFPLAPIVKAIGISGRRDLEQVEDYPKADEFLFDAKPPKGATREGGHGRAFDWSILKGFDPGDQREWTLSGGLTPENVADAIRISGAQAVDVSSGVEASPGIKDPAKVAAFIKAAKAAG